MFVTRLEIITPNLSKKEEATLRLWRVANMEYLYKDPFVITKDGFRKWLKNDLFKDGRKTWWVVCRGKRIGHIGLYKREWGWEVDNVLRGRTGFKGAMSAALNNLVKISKDMGISSLSLRVLESNERAITFYERAGFKKEVIKDGYLTMNYG